MNRKLRLERKYRSNPEVSHFMRFKDFGLIDLNNGSYLIRFIFQKD